VRTDLTICDPVFAFGLLPRNDRGSLVELIIPKQ